MDKLDIYVSTNIKGIRKGSGSYIWLIEMQTSKGPVTLCDKKEISDVTGRIAELTALTTALGRIKKPSELVFHITNSNLAKVFAKDWIQTWKESGWMDAKGDPVKDAEKWKAFYELYEKHKVLEITEDYHSYSSWMQNELGIEVGEEPQTRISSSYDKIRTCLETIESLDLSDVEENEELQTLINTLCRALFEKFGITQKSMNTGFVRMENPQRQKSTSYGKNSKISNVEIVRDCEASENANTDKELVKSAL